ncbi:MAG: hypothetical protein ACRYFS_10660 [Janthinobacterium lividum]
MTLTLSLDTETLLRTVADERGMAPEQLHEDLLREALAEAETKRQKTQTARKDRIQRFHHWSESSGHNTPLLSDSAISRASIYGDR